MNKKIWKAETLTTLLISLVLLTILILAYNKWSKQQHYQLSYSYQELEALQIADNQISLKMAGKSCENQITQNHLTFKIECQDEKIKVQFPLGNVEIGVAKKSSF